MSSLGERRLGLDVLKLDLELDMNSALLLSKYFCTVSSFGHGRVVLDLDLEFDVSSEVVELAVKIS